MPDGPLSRLTLARPSPVGFLAACGWIALGSGCAAHRPAGNTQQEILDVVVQHKGELAACADVQRKAEREVHGVVVLTWFIQQDGRTGQVGVRGTKFQESVIARCTMERIRSWKFQPHQVANPEAVTFPFQF